MPRATSDPWINLLQLLALIAAGLWALYLYRTSRRGQVKVGIEYGWRLVEGYSLDKSLLIVDLRLVNTSNVLWRHERAVATLFDARKLADDRTVRLVPFGAADPLLPVYGVTPDESEAFLEGRPFSYFEGQEVSLEPGEQVRTQVAFPLDPGKLGLMAVKVWLSGRQRRRSDDYFEWATFFFIDPRDPQDSPARMASS
jgi:hypothetical protein